MKQPISVVITYSGNARQLSSCIDRCSDLADEVLIAELAHDGQTESIASKSDRIRVVTHEPIRRDDFLNWAISQTSNDWVLLLDSDERMNQSLADEIELVLSRGADYDAYTIDRDTYFDGVRLEASGVSESRKIRLFRADQAFCHQIGAARFFEIQSRKVGKLSNSLSRHPDWRFDQSLKSIADDAAAEAGQWFEQGKKITAIKFIFSPAYQFAVQYFLRGSILDGLAGIRFSWQAAFKRFCAQTMLHDLELESTSSSKNEKVDPETIDLLDPTFRRAA